MQCNQQSEIRYRKRNQDSDKAAISVSFSRQFSTFQPLLVKRQLSLSLSDSSTWISAGSCFFRYSFSANPWRTSEHLSRSDIFNARTAFSLPIFPPSESNCCTVKLQKRDYIKLIINFIIMGDKISEWFKSNNNNRIIQLLR